MKGRFLKDLLTLKLRNVHVKDLALRSLAVSTKEGEAKVMSVSFWKGKTVKRWALRGGHFRASSHGITARILVVGTCRHPHRSTYRHAPKLVAEQQARPVTISQRL